MTGKGKPESAWRELSQHPRVPHNIKGSHNMLGYQLAFRYYSYIFYIFIVL
jgi:hypothetical protein